MCVVFSFVLIRFVCFLGWYLVETPHHRLGRGGAGPRSRIQLQPQWVFCFSIATTFFFGWQRHKSQRLYGGWTRSLLWGVKKPLDFHSGTGTMLLRIFDLTEEGHGLLTNELDGGKLFPTASLYTFQAAKKLMCWSRVGQLVAWTSYTLHHLYGVVLEGRPLLNIFMNPQNFADE